MSGTSDGRGRRARTRTVTAAEAALWRAAVRDVEPLTPQPPAAPGTTGASSAMTTAAPPAPSAPLACTDAPVSAAPAPATPERRAGSRFLSERTNGHALPALILGDLSGLDRRTGDRLRRGRLAIEDRLDLHGLTRAEAHGALAAFVRRCHAADRRLVLVITGKGGGSGGGGPWSDESRPGRPGDGVLRRSVPRWLADPPLRGIIAAIHPAHPRDGGAGALYVLLRRRRAPH